MSEFLSELEEEYKRKAAAGKLYAIQINDTKRPSKFDANTFKKWYNNYIRKEERGLFQKFPVVVNAHNQAICPMCEGVFSTKVTLEHIIPKGGGGDYRLAILPFNLIKCCGECNTSNHSEKSNCENNSEINPYFEEFDINKYLTISFEDIEKQGYLPKVEFNYNESTEGHRVRSFIDNYNIEKIYNHRIKLEYQKMLTTLASSPIISKKSSLESFIDRKRKDYEANRDYEKIGNEYWIDQNYFGCLMCEQLINSMKNDNTVYNKIDDEIQKIRKSHSSIVLSNEKFFNNLDAIKTVEDLEKFIKENKSDIIVYQEDRRKRGLSIEFPNLFSSEDNCQKKIIVEKIVDYYLENNKDFDDFAENCMRIIG